ncbi:hypothetical protein N431DRAFT_457332 [Stipitochalara longipes BDJ]|nr:hypothetical protein N431DRAFT_457332 [Stipitochalara longipes BDJ]
MPESIMLPSAFGGTDLKRRSQQLAPSIRIIQPASKKSSITGHGSTPEVCDVAYYIEARLFLKGHLVCEAAREIILMPIVEMPPPTEPGDLRNEYRLFTSSELSTCWRRKHNLMVSMSSSEPRPLLFDILTAKEKLPTNLVVLFSARRILKDNDCESPSKPEITECNLAITLEATTYFLRHEEESVLSVAEAGDIPFSVIKTTRFKSQRLKIRSLMWDRAQGSTSQESIYWETAVRVPVHLPSDAPRLPSFFSGLVSRRYAFHIEAKLGSESGCCLHDRLKLKVPVQVIHAPINTELGEEEEVDDTAEAPLYVP